MTVWSVRVVRGLVLIGLGVMGTVGLAAAIWRPVAGFVAGVLVVALAAVAACGVGVGARRIRAELAWRREPVAPAAAVMVVDEPDTTVFAESAPVSARLKKPA